jgi:isochorismate hydrolase
VIGGIESHVCVAQTAIDLQSRGFDTFIVADATSSRSKTSKRLALSRLAKSGAEIVDSEMVLFEWLGKAGTPEFKELHGLVK